MRVRRLWLEDFRCYERLELELPAGFTVVVGANGMGKTSLLEAVWWTSTTKSFRGVPDAALVRSGCDRAIVRAEVERTDREVLVEAELRAGGRNRVLVNRQPLTRSRDLLGNLRVTVFAPDDLQLVKGGPIERREYLDDLLVAMAPRYDAARTDYERVLRQRNTLLRQGAHDEAARVTLEVFDEQLAAAGAELVRGRLRLIDRLTPVVERSYDDLAGRGAEIRTEYVADWSDELGADADVRDQLLRALAAKRRQELDRGVTLAGPHRDDWRLVLGGLDARTHASQGEQRSLALALRLGGHRITTDLGDEPPVLLLDDVFSELDATRAGALLRNLPSGQTIVTAAGQVPDEVHPELRLWVEEGRVKEAGT
ncbi:MAG: DNA replication/repair protein RecF [Acidimicrobiia bacterium]